MKYVLAAIAGIWMADGLALLVAPRLVIARVREVLALSSTVLRWEGVAVCLGVLLLWGTVGLHYEPLWMATGLAMVVKGIFLAFGPEQLRKNVLDWCLHREDVDYRFWGLALCTLALLLLHAVGWLGNE
ncbi:MAG: DUF2065 family protein [Nitrospirota bacterium]|nr:DUF2065 family protein [Nitrospirota bacterium]MDE3035093.1 DUF2065 family protein [Nitrospirota bacterium]MDE3226215.1 DUF2065 family protein [Nitrospirota bacterium]MDE3243095.1 DUF2065 family protein [Nitrospirota bacterium]